MKSVQLSGGIIKSLMAFIMAVCCLEEGAYPAEVVLTGKAGSARMEAVREEVGNVRSNIFLTLLQLGEVRRDLNPAHAPFQAFTNQLFRMEELVRAFAERVGEMKARGAAYFADWETRTATIQDGNQRREAENRYAERKTSYDEINTFMQEARKPFLDFVQALNSLKTMILAGERNPKTITRAQDLFMQANWRCVDVQRALLEVEARLDRLAASFAKDLEAPTER